MKKAIKITLIIIGLLFLFAGTGFLYWILRPNTAWTAPELELESWDVPSDARHNAFTDLLIWKGYFYLTFRTAPDHGSIKNPKVVVLRSLNAKDWTQVAEFSGNRDDIRDPKLGIIGNKLFVYSIVKYKNGSLTTQYSYTENGTTWSTLQDVDPSGVRYWRPKTYDNITWYMPSIGDDITELWNSSDGITWTKVSTISDSIGADETDIIFLENGSMLATIRLQSWKITGQNEQTTGLALANPPYTLWTHRKSNVTRVDGPCLFSYANKTFLVGRYQPETDNLFNKVGSDFGKKRTSLYLVEAHRLVYLSDLPSSGDTSYPGAVVNESFVYISYYTSKRGDYPWLIGRILAAEVRIAKMNLTKLVNLADTRVAELSPTEETVPGFPLWDYIMFFALIGLCCVVGLISIKKVLQSNN